MCGIVSYIGKSKNPQVSHDLVTSLLRKTEIRGDDATGFWATEDKETPTSPIYFSKEPIKSTQFVNTEMWGLLKDKPINLFLGHCRKSTCRGSENVNKNNHPFLSSDRRTALVHNGVIPEYDALRSNYKTMSDCDSEILLRIVETARRYPDEYIRNELKTLKVKGNSSDLIEKLDETAELPYFTHRLMGLRDIFARINFGAMAVCLGERLEDGTRALWLFRDRDRPLQVVDMRKTLGQIFIVSEKRIWRDAVEATPSAKPFVKGNTPIIEFPAHYIWLLMVGPKGKFSVRKWKVNRQRKYSTTFEQERPKLAENQFPPRAPVTVITNLNHETHEVTKLVSEAAAKVQPGALTVTPPSETEKKTKLPTSPSLPAQSIETDTQKDATTQTCLGQDLTSYDVPTGHNIKNDLKVIRSVPPVFSDDEEEESDDDTSHQRIPLGQQRSKPVTRQNKHAIDQAEIDQYKETITKMRLMLNQIEKSVDAALASGNVNDEVFRNTLRGLEDLEKDMQNQVYTITHDCEADRQVGGA